jgi:uncharacterized protein YhfF
VATDQPGDLDRDAASALWRDYVATLPAAPLEEPTVERFGDGAGVPRCVLRSVDLRPGPLGSVDDAFAWDEGDRTRASWLDGHERYFRRTQAARGEDWSDDLEVVFERFRVVWPPDVAD